MARISKLDGYFISSLALTCAGIVAGLGLVTWLSFAFKWAPWALLALSVTAVVWFYSADTARTESIIRPDARAEKTHERVERP